MVADKPCAPSERSGFGPRAGRQWAVDVDFHTEVCPELPWLTLGPRAGRNCSYRSIGCHLSVKYAHSFKLLRYLINLLGRVEFISRPRKAVEQRNRSIRLTPAPRAKFPTCRPLCIERKAYGTGKPKILSNAGRGGIRHQKLLRTAAVMGTSWQ